MVSRKRFFALAAGRTLSFLQDAFADPAPSGTSSSPPPASHDDLLYEAMALGIDPATVADSDLADVVARARDAAKGD